MKKRLLNKLKWCNKQNAGIKLIESSENLCAAYLKKSNNSLISADANLSRDVFDWAIVATYYARYFSVYALLQKLGLKCEIHDCTISLLSFLVDENILSESILFELDKSKSMRINVQYYVEFELSKTIVIEDIVFAKSFVLELEKLIETLTSAKILKLRQKLIGVLQ